MKILRFHVLISFLAVFSLIGCEAENPESTEKKEFLSFDQGVFNSSAKLKLYWQSEIEKLPEPDGMLANMPLSEIESLYRGLTVYLWNKAYRGTRLGDFHYSDYAEMTNTPVSKLKEAEKFMERRIKALSSSLSELIDNDPKILGTAEIESTAYVGSYTANYLPTIKYCKREGSANKSALETTKRFKSFLPDVVDGFKITRIRYKCDELETSGVLEVGYLWRRNEEIEERKEESGMRGVETPEKTSYWNARAWNRGKPLKN